MIITKKVYVTVGGKHLKRYRELGYICNVKDTIEVNIEEVAINSKVRIIAMCDLCYNIKETNYCSYNTSISKGGFYCCSQKCSNDKVRKTNLERYGVEVPSKNKEILEKMQETCLEKYGVINPGESLVIKEKIKISNLKKYGVECSLQSEKVKEKIRKTNLERYGVINPSQSEIIKKKKTKTMQEKYNVNNPFSLPGVFEKSQKSNMKVPKKNYKDTNLHYQGTYELDFLEKYDYLNIENGITIYYNIDNKDSIYFSDFFLPKYNLIVEIKSTYTFNIDENRNLIKREYSIDKGYNHIFIIDKDYTEFNKIILKNNPTN